MTEKTKLTEKEKETMLENMEKYKDKETILPEIDEHGAYVYNKDNVSWELQKIFMPCMMSVVKEHLLYEEDEEGNSIPYIAFDYEKTMIYESEDNVNILIDIDSQQISAHFCIFIFDMKSNEKYKQPFSFYLDFEDINDFGMEYFNKIKEENKIEITTEENTIKITQRIKK